MKLHPLLLIISFFHILFASDVWKEIQENGIEYSFENSENDILEDFSDNNIFGESQLDKYTKSLKRNRKEMKQVPNEFKSKKVFPLPSQNITPCSCGMDYELIDLGHTYFPRNILSMICKESTCGNLYRCNKRYYKMRVLKKNPLGKTGKFLSILPGNLRQSWSPENINVVVACECIL